MSEIVTFRYSDVDFISYLMSNGFEFDEIEVIRDRNRSLKGFVHFSGSKSTLLKHFNEYQQGIAVANVQDLKSNRKKISKLIKSEILKYQANNL